MGGKNGVVFFENGPGGEMIDKSPDLLKSQHAAAEAARRKAIEALPPLSEDDLDAAAEVPIHDMRPNFANIPKADTYNEGGPPTQIFSAADMQKVWEKAGVTPPEKKLEAVDPLDVRVVRQQQAAAPSRATEVVGRRAPDHLPPSARDRNDVTAEMKAPKPPSKLRKYLPKWLGGN